MAVNEEVQVLKEKGNECVQNKKYAESVLHYSHAIKLDPLDYSLYSNRSLAFLKMQHFYFAMEDAKEAIRLKPDWAKPNDPGILKAIMKTSQHKEEDRKADYQIPWLGAGVGIIMGVIMVISDHILSYKPTLVDPILMALLTIAVAMLGYGFARMSRYYIKCQREALLEPPMDLFQVDKKTPGPVETSDTLKERRTHRSYRRADIRQRLKKGKTVLK